MNDAVKTKAQLIKELVDLRQQYANLEQATHSNNLQGEPCYLSQDVMPLVLDHLPMQIAYVDRDLRYCYVNKQFERGFNLPANEIVGKPIEDFMSQQDDQQLNPRLEAALSGRQVAFEQQIADQYGGARQVSVTYIPHRDAQGTVLGFVSIAQDMTERQRAEEQMRASEARFRDLVEGSIQGILIYQHGKTVFVNPSFVEMFGYASPSDIYQLSSLLEIIDPSDHERMLQYRDDRIAGRDAPSHYEFQGVQRDGSRIWLDMMARVVSWHDEPAIQITVFDKTASKVVEEALRRADRLAMLGRMAATFSHEARNPLQSLRLYAEILEEEINGSCSDSASASRKRMGDALDVIREQVTRVSDIVQDYLSLARLDSMNREPQDMGAFINGVVREQQAELTRRGLTLRLSGAHDLGIALIHASTFRRALLNVMQNAKESMGGDGCLTIRGGQRGDQLQILISDTGPGIAPESLAEIFTPFHTTKAEGAGLGLYVAQEIVNAHNGEIEVESELGRGTTFTITLPQVSGS